MVPPKFRRYTSLIVVVIEGSLRKALLIRWNFALHAPSYFRQCEGLAPLAFSLTISTTSSYHRIHIYLNFIKKKTKKQDI